MIAMLKNLQMIGKHFGYLTVIGHAFTKNQANYWTCKCKCGNEINVRTVDLNNGHTKSCGCYKIEKFHNLITKHNMSKTRLYACYKSMLARCYLKSYHAYHRYGGRGIKVCEEWNGHFDNFANWAITHGYSDNLTLDRINNDQNYCPENCTWVSKEAQSSKTSRLKHVMYMGKEYTISELSQMSGLKKSTIGFRIRNHWDESLLLSKPCEGNVYKKMFAKKDSYA